MFLFAIVNAKRTVNQRLGMMHRATKTNKQKKEMGGVQVAGFLFVKGVGHTVFSPRLSITLKRGHSSCVVVGNER